MSREPIGERGGKNIYAFVKNNTFSFIDYLGLAPQQTIAVSDGPGGYTDPDSAQSYMTPGMVTPLFGPVGNYQGLGPGLYNPTTPMPVPSAWQEGVDWLSGVGTDSYHGPADKWTLDLQRSAVMERDREKMRAKLKEFCKSDKSKKGSITVDLGWELRDTPRGYYFFGQFPYELIDNPKAAFVGSWTYGSIVAPNVDCCSHKTKMTVHAYNVESISSITHLPPMFGMYWSWGKDNYYGESGPMHNVTQEFEWEETVEY